MSDKERIFVVGGGPTVKECDLTKLAAEKTIAVNVAAFDIPNPDYFITMDHSFKYKVRRELTKLPSTNVFVAGLHHDYLVEERGQIIDRRWRKPYHLEDFHLIIKSYKQEGCGFSWRDFRSGNNSGFCGLQLAVLLGYTEVYLVGIDLETTDSTHYHMLYPKRRSFKLLLRDYAHNFRLGLKDIQEHGGINVYSCSPISTLNNNIPYVPYDEVVT